VSKARRRTARRLEGAASVVDDQGRRRKGRSRKPLLLALVAGAAGWVYVKVIRSGRPEAEELTDEADRKAAAVGERAAAKVSDTAEKVAEEADEVRKAQRQHARSGGGNSNAAK
jgi:hypothetical protein